MDLSKFLELRTKKSGEAHYYHFFVIFSIFLSIGLLGLRAFLTMFTVSSYMSVFVTEDKILFLCPLIESLSFLEGPCRATQVSL